MVRNPVVSITFKPVGTDTTISDIRRIQNEISKISAQNREAEREAKRLSDAFGLSAAEARKISDSLQGVAAQASRAGDEIKGAESAGNGLSGAFAGLAAGATFAAIDLVADTLRSLTQAAIGFVAESVNLNRELRGTVNALEVILGSGEAATENLEILRQIAEDTGISFQALSRNYAGLTAAANKAGIEQNTVNELFSETSRVAGIFGLTQERTNRTFGALQQIISKGTVSLEELRQQLGEQLPIALAATAEGLGLTTGELNDLVSSGGLASEDFVVGFVNGLRQIEGEIDPANAAISRLQNQIFDLQRGLGEALEPFEQAFTNLFSGVFNAAGEIADLDGFTAAAEGFRDALEENPEIAIALGEALGTVAQILTDQVIVALETVSTLIRETPDSITDALDRFVSLAETVDFALEGVIGLAGAVKTVKSDLDILLQPSQETLLGQVLEEIAAGLNLITNPLEIATGTFGEFLDNVTKLRQQGDVQLEVGSSGAGGAQALLAATQVAEEAQGQLQRQRLEDERKLAEIRQNLQSEINGESTAEAEKQAREEEKRRVAIAKAEGEALKQAREDAKVEENRIFNDSELAAERREEERARRAEEAFESSTRNQKATFEAQQRDLESLHEQDLQAREGAFNEAERQKSENFEASLEQRKEKFSESQRAAEEAFSNQQAQERDQFNTEQSALEAEVQARLELLNAESSEERKLIQERLEAEKEASELRRQVEAEVLGERNSVLGEADLSLSPLQQAQADFEAKQREERESFENQQNQARLAFEAEIQALQQAEQLRAQEAERAFVAEKAPLEQAFEEQARQSKLSFEDSLRQQEAEFEASERQLEQAFQDSQLARERAFKDEQRSLDRQNAEAIANLLSNARASGGNVQSLRSGGVTEGGLTQLHRDEFVIMPQGARVISQQESRSLVRESLQAPTGAAVAAVMGRGRGEIEAPRGAQARQNALMRELLGEVQRTNKLISSKPPVALNPSFNMAPHQSSNDAIELALKYQRDLITRYRL